MLLATCLALTGCGAIVNSSAQPGPACAVGTTGLLALGEMPSELTLEHEGTSPVLGLLGNGDNAYPDFKGRSQRDFIWTGLLSGTPRALVEKAWSDLHYSGTAPVTFIPAAGQLYVTYPTQLFHVAESTMDFGSVQAAQKWLSDQRQLNAPNSDPKVRAGVESNPATVQIGDDTFTYQVTHGASGDVFTDIEARVGSVILAVSIDGGPSYDGVGKGVGLVGNLHAKEHATCGVA